MNLSFLSFFAISFPWLRVQKYNLFFIVQVFFEFFLKYFLNTFFFPQNRKDNTFYNPKQIYFLTINLSMNVASIAGANLQLF